MMAYRYYQQLPQSKGAALANVLGSLFGEMRLKERERQKILQMEDERLLQNRMETERLMAQKPEVFGPGTQPKMSDREKAELAKIQAETARIKSETAKNVWDRAGQEREADLNQKLREAELANKYLNYQNQLERMEFERKAAKLQEKYKDGPPKEIDEFMQMIKYYEEMEKDLLSKRENVRNGDDDLFADYTDKIRKLRKQLNWLRESHPYGKLIDTMMPPEVAPEEKGPSWLGRRWQDVKDLGGEAVDMLQGEKSLSVTPQAPQARDVEKLDAMKPPNEVPRWKMLLGGSRLFTEDDLDYLVWYAARHPEDKQVVNKLRTFENDPRLAWYFKGK